MRPSASSSVGYRRGTRRACSRVASIQPLVTARTEISAAALARSRRVSRWQRVAVASVKQCGRAVVPPVHEAVPLEAYLVGVGACLMLVEPGAAGHVVGVRDIPATESVRVMVGPEGGWTPEEVAAAERAGARLVSLGARTLRADAVPLVALTALMTIWSEL